MYKIKRSLFLFQKGFWFSEKIIFRKSDDFKLQINVLVGGFRIWRGVCRWLIVSGAFYNMMSWEFHKGIYFLYFSYVSLINCVMRTSTIATTEGISHVWNIREAPPPKKNNLFYLGQLTQIWVYWVEWSQTFIDYCFFGIFDHYFRLKVFHAKSPKSMKLHGVGSQVWVNCPKWSSYFIGGFPDINMLFKGNVSISKKYWLWPPLSKDKQREFVFCNVLRIGTSLDVRVVQTCLSGQQLVVKQTMGAESVWYRVMVWVQSILQCLMLQLMVYVFVNAPRFHWVYRVVQCIVFSFLYRLDTSMPCPMFLDALASLRLMIKIKWFTFLRLLQLEPCIVTNCFIVR